MNNKYSTPYARVTSFNPIEMTISRSIIGHSTDPDIFGPSFWFTLHNGAVVYPKNPNELHRTGMKQLLFNLPLLVPCINCKEHFHAFLRDANLDDAVSSRDKLFKFFVDIHNYVNKRYSKPIISIEDAKILYGFDNPNGSDIRISYT